MTMSKFAQSYHIPYGFTYWLLNFQVEIITCMLMINRPLEGSVAISRAH